MQSGLTIRLAWIAVLCAAVTACSSPSSGDEPGGGELSPQFLDMLAPVDGDSGARADESANVLLARAEVGAVTGCMKDAGFAEYAELPVLIARDRNNGHPEFFAPAKLESRGLTAMSDPGLENVPSEAQSALGTCVGEGGARSVSEATDRFVVFRDGAENPLASWPETFRTEVQRIAESDDPQTIAYRECFRQLGVPADVARSPSEAGGWLIGDMNQRTSTVSADAVQAWQRGDGILDADGGALAREAAICFRQFETLLTPRLEELRDAAVDENRERLLEGQELFYEAIGSEEFDPGDSSF